MSLEEPRPLRDRRRPYSRTHARKHHIARPPSAHLHRRDAQQDEAAVVLIQSCIPTLRGEGAGRNRKGHYFRGGVVR